MDMHASGPPPAAPPVEELLRHAGWMRRLARELAGRSGADDLVQDVWVATLERPPKSVAELRGWLARVLANRARSLGRSEQRRARREAARAASADERSTDELLSELELARRVAEAVRELDEPYRTVVLLRFYRDLSPSAIAAQQGIPAATVRSHLKRGLDQLRARFDREHGGERSAWSAAMLAWAGVERPLVALSGLTLALGTLALMAAGGTTLWLTRADDGVRAEEAPLLAAATRAAGSAAPAEATEREVGTASTPVPPLAREPAAASSAEAETERALFIGSVRAPDGSPIEGATLSIYPDKSWPRPEPLGTGRTDAHGRFAFPTAPTSSTYLMLGAEAPGFQGLTTDPVVAGNEIAIELAWQAELFGVVREAGSLAPLAGAVLAAGLARTTSDEHGAYRLGGFASGSQLSLRVRHAGHAAREREVFLRGKEPQRLDLELVPGTPTEIELVDEQTGAPLAGVEIRDAERDEPWSVSSEEGRFTEFLAPDQLVKLFFAHEAYWPTHWDWAPARVEPGPLRVPMARRIWVEGRITDPEGAPIEGAWVGLRNEERDDGDELRPEVLRSLGTPGRVWHGQFGECLSDSEGRYRLPILASEDARTLTAGRKGLVGVERGPLEFPHGSSGATIDLVLARGARIHGHARFAGKAWRGRVVLRAPAGDVLASRWVDGDGAFDMDGVPAGPASLGPASPDETGLPTLAVTIEAGKVYEHDFEWGDAPALGTIAGRVLVERKPPAGVVYVTAQRGEGRQREAETQRVGADGSFALRVPAGAYEVHTWERTRTGRVSSAERRVNSGCEDLVLEHPAVGVLRLRLVDAATRAAVRSETTTHALRWRRADGEERGEESPGIDLSGGIELEMALGDYEVTLDLRKEGYLPSRPMRVAVSSALVPEPCVVALERGLDLRLQLNGPEGSRFPGPVLFVLERGQLAALSGPYPRQGGPANHSFGGSSGIHLRIDDPALMGQHLGRDEFFAEGGFLRGLAPGHYFVKAFPDELVLEPSEFDLAGPERAEVRVRWRPR